MKNNLNHLTLTKAINPIHPIKLPLLNTKHRLPPPLNSILYTPTLTIKNLSDQLPHYPIKI
jgi:hypothetical protein